MDIVVLALMVGAGAAEGTSQQALLGLWANPYYSVKKAEVPAEILEPRGRFALVEGKVLTFRASGGMIYVNFGRRWSRDFMRVSSRRQASSRKS